MTTANQQTPPVSEAQALAFKRDQAIRAVEAARLADDADVTFGAATVPGHDLTVLFGMIERAGGVLIRAKNGVDVLVGFPSAPDLEAEYAADDQFLRHQFRDRPWFRNLRLDDVARFMTDDDVEACRPPVCQVPGCRKRSTLFSNAVPVCAEPHVWKRGKVRR